MEYNIKKRYKIGRRSQDTNHRDRRQTAIQIDLGITGGLYLTTWGLSSGNPAAGPALMSSTSLITDQSIHPTWTIEQLTFHSKIKCLNCHFGRVELIAISDKNIRHTLASILGSLN